MKQSKRLLCVLLSMIMILSGLTIGVSAYKTDYNKPAEWSNVYKPVFNVDQASTAVLDFVDDLLAGDDGEGLVNEHIKVVDIDIRIQSIDTTFNSVRDIFDSTTYKIIKALFDLGDVEDLDVSIPKNSSIRRSNASLSDTQMFVYFLQFVSSNADPLYKIADNTLDLGFIGNFFDMREEVPMLNDLHGYLNEILYKALINEDGLNSNGTTFVGSSTTLDAILQDFINNRCLKLICDGSANADGTNDIADFLGLPTNPDGTLAKDMGILDLCPSLSASDISLTTTSTYDFIEKLFKALIDDVVVNFAGDLILDALEIDPNDPTGDTSYINIAITLFVTAESLGLPEDASETDVIAKFLENEGVENPENPKPIDKTNAALKYILSEGLTQYVNFVEDGNGGKYLHLDDELVSKLSDYIKMFLPMLGSLVADFPSLTAEQIETLNGLNEEQTFAFLVKYLLENLVEGVVFSDECDSIKELATYTLVNVAAELAPDIDYEAKIESGEINPNSDDCLDIAATVIRYYLVGEFGMDIPKNVTFVELLNDAFDFFLEKYATLFNIYPNDSARATYQNNVWYKIYRSAGEWIRLTSLCYGVEDSWAGLQDLIMNKIVGNVLNFDLNGLLSIIGRKPSSQYPELDKPFSKLVANLLARVLNSVFRLSTENDAPQTNSEQLKLIVPYTYTTLDQITTNVNSGGVNNGTGLKNTVKMLLTNIPNISGANSLLGTSLDLVAELVGIIDLDEYDYVKMQFKSENSGMTYSMADLRSLASELAISENEGIKYYEDNYRYFRMVDFAPWAYLEFKRKLRSAESVIEQYDNAKINPEKYEYPSKAEITYTYYALSKMNEIIEAHKATTNTYQLQKVYNNIVSQHIVNTDGQKYSIRTWKDYTNAMNFADKVFAEYRNCNGVGYRQSKINMARKQLLDAVAGLKPYTGLADYTGLDSTIARTLRIENPDIYTSSTLKKLIEAFKEAQYLDRDYGSDEQNVVTLTSTSLQKAIDGLQTVTYIEVMDSSTQHIDEVNGLYYGLGENYYSQSDKDEWGDDYSVFFTSMNGYISVSEEYAGYEIIMNLASTNNGNGTGSKIQVAVPNDDGTLKVIKEYSMVVFGDLTGDGVVDGTDAVVMKTYAALMQEVEFAPKCVLAAGDLNFNGDIGGTDITAVINCGLGKETVEQSPEQIVSQTRTFADLL